MKFTDGLWLIRDGVKPSYARDVQTTEVKENAVHMTVSSKLVQHRGDTLYGPVLHVDVTSPAEGIIGVKTEHRTGWKPKGPNYELFPDGPPPSHTAKITDSADVTTIEAGSLTAKITKKQGAYGIEFATTGNTNRPLTVSGYKAQAVIDVPHKWTINSAPNSSSLVTDRGSNPTPPHPPPFVRYILNELQITTGETLYGLGEQFGPFVKNGQVVSVWNRDGGTSSEQAYKSVPFYISSRGYGVFINHSGDVELEVGVEKASRVGISVTGSSLEYFIIHGPTPLAILERYTLLTGKPGLPPNWTFGLWLSTSFTTSYDSKTVAQFLTGMKERKCDVRVFHFDCFWMKQYEWCSFTFDPDNFPDPAAYLKEIKEKFGVRVCVWINPYISALSPIYQEGVDNGYFIKRTNGDAWSWDLWQPGMAIVDFSNPAAATWYAEKLEKLIDLGVDCFKTDFGERIPHVDVVFHDGSNPEKMHNAYSVIYNKLVFSVLEKRFGKNEACLFARSGSAGSQRFPVHWGGDCESTFEAMAETLRGGLSLTASGFGFTSHDIGGFEGHPPASVYMRWVAYGLFSSHSRLHGSSSYRVPWNYGEEAPKVLAKFLDAKHRLMPYLWQQAVVANQKGHPVQRAMFFDFPTDRTTYHLDQQFMFGPSLLVAPVFTDDEAPTEFYLPAGTWTSFWDPSDIVEGPKWVSRVVPYDLIPVFVRENTVLVLGPEGVGKPDYEYTKDVEVRVYGLKSEGSSAEAIISTGKGTAKAAVITASNKGGKVEISVSDGELTSHKAFHYSEGKAAAI